MSLQQQIEELTRSQKSELENFYSSLISEANQEIQAYQNQLEQAFEKDRQSICKKCEDDANAQIQEEISLLQAMIDSKESENNTFLSQAQNEVNDFNEISGASLESLQEEAIKDFKSLREALIKEASEEIDKKKKEKDEALQIAKQNYNNRLEGNREQFNQSDQNELDLKTQIMNSQEYFEKMDELDNITLQIQYANLARELHFLLKQQEGNV